MADPRQRARVPRVVCIIDYETCERAGVDAVAAAALCANEGATILARAKTVPDDVRHAFYREAVRYARHSGARCLVSGDPEAALVVQADGAHLPSDAPLLVRLSDHMLCGRSAHSIADIERAATEGCDYVFLSPIFDSTSKAAVTGRGLGFLRSATRVSTLPVIALGGLTPERIADTRAAGAYGVAAIGPFASAQAARNARAFLRANRRAGGGS